MNQVVKIVGALVIAVVILGLPVLACLSFVLKWDPFFCVMLLIAITGEIAIVAAAVLERSEDD